MFNDAASRLMRDRPYRSALMLCSFLAAARPPLGRNRLNADTWSEAVDAAVHAPRRGHNPLLADLGLPDRAWRPFALAASWRLATRAATSR